MQAKDAQVPGKVMLASEQWNDYTNKDGSGLAWDVLRQVFEPAGITVQTRSVPYTRMLCMTGAWPSWSKPASSSRFLSDGSSRTRFDLHRTGTKANRTY